MIGPLEYRVFMAPVTDEQDTPDSLLVELSSDVTGFICYMVPDGQGNAQCEAELPLGEYLLSFDVEDSDGNIATARAVFEVVDLLNYDADGDGVSPNGGDCDDSNATIIPGAPEI